MDNNVWEQLAVSSESWCSMNGPGWREYRAEQRRVLENMKRLRALRLEKERKS